MKTRVRQRMAKQASKKLAIRRQYSEVAAPQTSSKTTYLWCLVLAVVTFAVYYPAISHPFVNYDDFDYVTQNAHVQAGLTADTFAWALSATDAANWHPVTWLSHALDYQLYGANPHGHHLSSVLLHTANVVLLFLILQWATGATGMSAMVAALFALHPLNVESVAWVAERKNVLSTLFFLLTLAAYGRYARRPNLGRYLLVATVFALGLASKPMLVTLPFVLLLLDYWPLGRIEGWTEPSACFPVTQVSWRTLLLEKFPLLALSAASSAITMIAQSGGGAVQSIEFISWKLRLENGIYSYAKYILKLFWPVHLAVVYPHPLNKLSVVPVVFSALFLVAISLMTWRWRKQYPFAITGWLWFLGTLVPVIGIVQVGDQGIADRYMYIPAIGIFVALVWGINQWAGSQKWFVGSSTSIGLKAISAAVLLVMGILTVHQIGYWSSSYNLWSHTLQITDDNYVAHDHLGGLLILEGKADEANRHFAAAARAAPWDPVSHLGLGAAAQDRGDLQEAIGAYRVALRSKDPELRALTYVNLGVVYRQLGDYAAARQNSEQALAQYPKIFGEMIQQITDALQEAPSASGYVRLGFLLEGAGRVQDAKSAFERALQIERDYEPARKALQDIMR
jgi:protein O-mannosyl-transferase